MEPYDFRRISVTALVPAFVRGDYTDIPYAKEMLDHLRARGVGLSGTPWSEPATNGMASFLEARFKSVNRLLEEYGATQVLELAAGFRRVAWTFRGGGSYTWRRT